MTTVENLLNILGIAQIIHPKGDFPAVIIDARLGNAASGTPYLSVTFQTRHGQVYQALSFEHTTHNIEDVKRWVTQLIGKEVTITVEHIMRDEVSWPRVKKITK